MVCWIYLYEAEHPVMEGSGGVVLGQDGPDQNSFNKVLRRHQNVEAVAAVLDARFKHLSGSSHAASHLPHSVWAYVLHTQWPLTVRDSMISWKFRLPTILFFRALTESLGLQIIDTCIRRPVFKLQGVPLDCTFFFGSCTMLRHHEKLQVSGSKLLRFCFASTTRQKPLKLWNC